MLKWTDNIFHPLADVLKVIRGVPQVAFGWLPHATFFYLFATPWIMKLLRADEDVARHPVQMDVCSLSH